MRISRQKYGLFHIICQVIFVPAEGGGASRPEYSEQVKIRGT